MNQKVSEGIKKNEIDLDNTNSWTTILQTNEKDVTETKLSIWTPRNLYELEKVNKGAFHEVLEGLTPIIQVGVSKLLQYLNHEEQNKLHEEKIKQIRELNEATQGNSHIQIHNFVGTTNKRPLEVETGPIWKKIRSEDYDKTLEEMETQLIALFFKDFVLPGTEEFLATKEQVNHLLGPFADDSKSIPLRSNSIEPLFSSFFYDSKFEFTTSQGHSPSRFDMDIAVSGSGKTYRLYNIACFSGMYLMFVNAAPNIGNTGSELQGSVDYSFQSYYEHVEKAIDQGERQVDQDGKLLSKEKLKEEQRKNYTESVESLSHLFILTRIIYLGILLKLFPKMTPREFLFLQLNGYTKKIQEIFKWLYQTSYMDKSTLIDLIDHYFTSFLHERTKNKIGIAIDEASGLIKSFPGKFLSPNKNLRGLVAPFEDALSSLLPHVNYMTHSGTSFTIRQGQEILSSIGKKAVDLYNRFPYFQSIEEVVQFLAVFLNLKGCEPILEDKSLMHKLVGRKRIAALVIKVLSKKIIESKFNFITLDEEAIEFKCNILEDSIDEAYDLMKRGIISRTNHNLNFNFINETKSVEEKLEETKRFVSAMTTLVSLSVMSCEPLLELNYNEQDIMDLGITNIEMTKRKVYRLQEVLAYDVGFHYATEGKEQEIVKELVRTLHFDPKGQEKGYHFERLIYLQLKKITKGNPPLSNLSFLQEPIPDWMKNIEFKIDKFGTYRQLNMRSDFQVIQEMISGKIKNVLLKPSDDMGPDGLWVSVQDGKVYIVSIGMKFYTSYNSEAQTKNQLQSNLGHVYTDEFGKIRPKFKKIHQEFHGMLRDLYQKEVKETRQTKKIPIPLQQQEEKKPPFTLGGILRIHVQTPTIKGEPIPHHEVESICNLDLNALSKLIHDSRLFEFIQSICK
jgi:hypothetical protein